VCRKERGVEEGSARDRVDPFYSGVVGEAAEGGGAVRGSHTVAGRSGIRWSCWRRQAAQSRRVWAVQGRHMARACRHPKKGRSGSLTSGPRATVMGGGDGFDLK
jgi:hypothetical protein